MRGGPKLEKLWKSDGEKKPSTLNSKKYMRSTKVFCIWAFDMVLIHQTLAKKIIHDRGKTF